MTGLQWTDATERKPSSSRRVLARTSEGVFIEAAWVSAYTHLDHDDYNGGAPHSGPDGHSYWPEGWYQWNIYEKCYWALRDGEFVTYWAPLNPRWDQRPSVFITSHAIERFRERICDMDDWEVRKEVLQALQCITIENLPSRPPIAGKRLTYVAKVKRVLVYRIVIVPGISDADFVVTTILKSGKRGVNRPHLVERRLSQQSTQL